MIFIPKKHARHIAIPTSLCNECLGSTMVISCLYVIKDYGGRGIASEMIQRLITFCRERGYSRIEACVDPGTPEEAGINTSFYPFRKFGFTVDESREGWEFRPETRICSLELSEGGEVVLNCCIQGESGASEFDPSARDR